MAMKRADAVDRKANQEHVVKGMELGRFFWSTSEGSCSAALPGKDVAEGCRCGLTQ